MIHKKTKREKPKVNVWIWLPDATEPVVAGKLEADGQGNVQFNYGKSYLDRINAIPHP